MRTALLVAVATAFSLVSCSPAQVAGPRSVPAPKAASSAAPSPSPIAAGSPSCAAPDGHEPSITLNGAPLTVLCHGLHADPATTSEQRAALKRWYGESLSALASVFGAPENDPPTVVSCVTDACELHFSGPTRRSRAMLEPRPMVVINGIGSLTKGTMVHEMVHVEIARRMGRTRAGGVPTWFDEGVATFVGDNAPCPAGTKRAIDDLRRLEAPYAWEGFTNMTGKIGPAYCQARDEIAAWVARRSRPALVEVIDAVAAGRGFDEVYGPVVTAIPYLFLGSDNGARCWSPAIDRGDWNGALDELRVYDYALTPEQVASDMRSVTP